jgi:(p)ppGpp synthase/HD superfamily hydrolase
MATDGVVSVFAPNARLAGALRFASALHDGQTRKGTRVPYVAHLLGVAALVLEDGGTETEAVAALLHDAIEDTAVTPKQLRKRFGRRVARIVAECSDLPMDDSLGRAGKKGKPKKGSKVKRGREREREHRDASNWHERKLRSLEHLNDPATSRSALRVRAADALYNARATVADLRRFGPEAWRRFNAGAIDQLWYYRSMSVLLSARLPGMLSDELRASVSDMERLAGWWFDVGDPQRF